MNASRIALIPIAHIAAEVIAYPLASEAGLSLALKSLRPALGAKTADLWRQAEQDLLRSHPSISLDELVAIRDDVWFHGNQELPLGEYLRSIASRFFEVRGSRVFPRLGLRMTGPPGHEGDGVARAFCRWLSFALPMDLLLAAFDDGKQCPRAVETVSPLLDRRLRDYGFAEPHVHLNGCFDFDSIWVSTLRGLSRSSLRPDVFASPGACLKEGSNLAGWLLRAALTRYILAAFLEQREGRGDLWTFLRDTAFRKVQNGFGPGMSTFLHGILEDLLKGSLSDDLAFTKIRFLYRSMIDTISGQLPREAEEIWRWDPIFPLCQGWEGPPEVHLMARSLRYLDEFPADDLFARLFWQVQRVRCLFYRHLVQRPLTPGLQWFVRFFKRIKEARTLFGTHFKGRTAARLCGGERGLRSLEVRSAPEADVSTTFREILDLDEALRRQRGSEIPCEFGIVWHFGREREGEWPQGRPAAYWSGTAADPRVRDTWKKDSNSTGYRYGRFYKRKRTDAQAAARVLTLFPRSLEIVRGLDLCTDEAGVPIWVMAPLVRYVQDAGRAASTALRERLGLDIPPLRMTVHAGEDFVHLLSGLRRLDEAIDHLQLGEGDRLGHGLSLGVDPKTWAQRAGQLAIPREERLLDLAWEWAWSARSGQGPPGDRRAFLQREIAEHSREMFAEELTPWQVGQLVEDLHDEKTLCAMGFPDRPYPKVEEPRWRWLLAYLTRPDVFKRGREIVWIDPVGETDSILHLQEGLRRKVGRMGLTIEVNPSSNLLIGQLGEIGDHPLWRLCPPGKGDGIPPLSVCIGSDDPLTFATTLREEYQLLYDALVCDGHSESVAHTWLERARSTGLTARFTLPESLRLWEDRLPASRGDLRREALTFTPLAWTAKLDLPP